MKNILYIFALVMVGLMLSGWGSKGHKKISQNMAPCLPAEMSFLSPGWTNYVGSHASDADYRKDQDPDESPRHYLDIDNYPVFLENGFIPHYYDTVVMQFGYNFVIDQGTLPWSTLITFDSLKSCFQRGDWNRSAFFAADLGHYIGDGHMPLHITRNYNGQYTGQINIHSRYESTMIGKYESQLVYPADTAVYIDNVREFIFNYIYEDYKYVDSVLLADSYATVLTGSTSSTAYYQALWEKSGAFTKLLMQRASGRLADLIYTAWVQAGSPMMYPNAVAELGSPDEPRLLQLFPNPAGQKINVPVVVPGHDVLVTIKIYNNAGLLVESLPARLLSEGYQKLEVDISNQPQGIYYCLMQTAQTSVAQKFIVSR